MSKVLVNIHINEMNQITKLDLDESLKSETVNGGGVIRILQEQPQGSTKIAIGRLDGKTLTKYELANYSPVDTISPSAALPSRATPLERIITIDLSSKLRMAMSRHGHSRADVYSLSGVSKSTISAIRNVRAGNRTLRVYQNTWDGLSAYLGTYA